MYGSLLFLLPTLGCAPKKTRVLPPNQTPASEVTVPNSPKTDNSSLQIMLSAHDSLPCSRLNFETKEPWNELNSIVLEVEKPPWAAMRAASCMIELHPTSSQEFFLEWIVDAKSKGLAFLLAKNIDAFPLSQGLALVEAALKGENAEGCRIRFQNSQKQKILDALQ